MLPDEPFALAAAAAECIRGEVGGPHRVAVVAGSGWGDALGRLGREEARWTWSDLPGFGTASVPGHSPSIASVVVAGTRTLVFGGRLHLYEDVTPREVVHGVRTAVAAGASTVILTCAAGSLSSELGVASPVLVADHLNLTGCSPLTGPEPPAPRAGRFVDLSDLYSARLRRLVHRIEPTLAEGVYAGLSGPHFETPAEIRMLRTLGADLVGMSMVLEAIAAHHAGAEVLGIALVTNAAAGLTTSGLDHAEVLSAGAAAGERLTRLLASVLEVV